MFDAIYKGLGWVLKLFNTIGGNYVVALLLFALVVKILLFPLGIKQQKNSIKQAKLRPKEMAIRKKYAGRTDKPTQMKMNEEISQLYQAENFNPLGGCLPLLIQFPLIIMLYQVIRNPLQYICGLPLDVIKGFDLGQDQIMMIGTIRDNFAKYASTFKDYGITSAEQLPNFSFFGFGDFTQKPQFWNWYLLIPVFTFIFMFFGMKITRKYTYNPQAEAGGDAAKSMALMDWTMPLISVYMTFIFSAMLGLYWIFQNILGTVQQVILAKIFPIPQFTEEEYKQAEKEMNKNYKPPKKPAGERKAVRSLHHIDDEDYIQPPIEQPKKKKTEKNSVSDLLGKPELKDDEKDD